jgi:ribonuclease HII
VIGLDEVGWGAIAGPLVVSATVLPFEFENPVIKKTKAGVQYGFKDSKRFTTDKSRRAGAAFARKNVLAHETLFSMPRDIATYGPAKALSYLQRKLARRLLMKYPNALLIVDGNQAVSGIRRDCQIALVGADAKVPAVSAASIIAKVTRDEYMIELGADMFPYWQFHKNKGYPTPEHVAKLRVWGPTRIHRLNVGMVEDIYLKKGWYEDGAEATEGHQARVSCG